jgi:hypothetical protein
MSKERGSDGSHSNERKHRIEPSKSVVLKGLGQETTEDDV